MFDRIAQHLQPDRRIGEKCVFSQHYKLLIKAMDVPTAEKPHLVKKFLDGWYKKVYKEAPDYETHLNDGYSGYWSWEAAAVVMIWEIDDSSFRDHPNYPDALVDYFRNDSLTQSNAG